MAARTRKSPARGTDHDSAAAATPRRTTHANSVRMTIENEIYTGVLLPGTPIDEDALVQRFSVSRTPVREAMLQLLQAGLIEKAPRQPAVVARLDLPRLLHLFETVAELEGVCARIAASRMTTEERNELSALHESAAKVLAEGDDAEYARLGRRFHNMIVNGTHNNVLIDITNKLALRTLSYRRFQVLRPGRPDINQSDHQAVLDAILARDQDRAAEAMRAHVTLNINVLSDYVSLTGMDSRGGLSVSDTAIF